MQNSSAFQNLAIDTIHESTTNPRRTFEESKLQELAESIRHHGLIQPVTVRPNADGFELIAGARRYRAAQLAELFSIPARIVEIDDAQALEWQLVENSQRVDVHQRTAEELLFAAIDSLADEKLTGFTLRLALTSHVAIPRDGETDILAEAEAVFLQASQPKKASSRKAGEPTPIKDKKTAPKKKNAA